MIEITFHDFYPDKLQLLWYSGWDNCLFTCGTDCGCTDKDSISFPGNVFSRETFRKYVPDT